MSVQVKGSGTIGGLDEGLVVSGIVTSSTQINVGNNIKLGNAGVVTATSFVGNLTGTIQTALQTNITRVGTLTQLSVSGTTNPLSVTHTGGDGFQITRGSKILGFNANFGASDTHSAINVSSGMSLRLQVNANDRVVMDSNGRLGIGDIAPDTALHVKSSDNVLATFESTDADSLIEFKDNGTSDTILMGSLGGDDLLLRCDAGNVIFKVANNNEKFRIGSSGQIGLSGANYGSSGQVLTSAGSGSAPTWATPSAGLSYAQQWRLGNNGTTVANTDNVLPTGSLGWSKQSTGSPGVSAGTLGSDMSESNGVFTFPATGIWKIEFYGYWGIGANDSDHYLASRIQTTVNNSSWTTVQEQVNSVKTDATYTYQGFNVSYIFDVTSTSNCKARFVLNPSGSNTYYKANSNPPMTGSLFMRLGDT